MPRRKKPMGRPSRPLPPRIDATAEEIADVFMRTPPPGPVVDYNKVYRCGECNRVVAYPEVLYRDGKCENCHVPERKKRRPAQTKGILRRRKPDSTIP